MQPLADAVALALENVRLFQKTRELSITDEVTPLYNYRFFHQILDRELKLVDRYKSVLSLSSSTWTASSRSTTATATCAAAACCARSASCCARPCARPTIPARYGGDEFVVILPQTDAAAAACWREKLRRADRGAHVPPGGRHQRARRRLAGRRDLSRRGAPPRKR